MLEVNEEGGWDESVKLLEIAPQEACRQTPEETDLCPEDVGELPPECSVGQGVVINKIESAPFVMEHFSRYVNKGKPMEPAGHGAKFIDEAPAVLPEERARSFIVIWHENFPLFFGTVVEKIGRIELGPKLLKHKKARTASLQYLPSGAGIQLIKTLFKERRI